MRIAEYKRINSEIVTETVIIPAEYDEDGILIADEHEETITKEVPVMGMVYRDTTPEEEAQYAAEQAEAARREAEREPTAEEQLRADVDFLLAMGGML